MRMINQKYISAGEYSPGFVSGTPFLIEGCMILQCVKGYASFTLDFKHYDVSEGCVVFLFNDMVIELGDRSDDFAIRYVSITAERVFEIYVGITSQKLWSKLYLAPVKRLEEQYREPFDRWMRQCVMVTECCRRQTIDTILPGLVISLFLFMEDIIINSGEQMVSVGSNSHWKMIGDFFVLLSRHYMTQHKVSFYARSLNITPDYLSALMREYVGITPKETIEGKLVLAMKALLESTGLSVKSIAYRLHYEDSSHMCKVFRRNTGMSPVEYRKSRNK